MAHSVLDWIQPSGVGGTHSLAVDQTAPVTQAEIGRAPQIAGGLTHPPPYQPTPTAGGILADSPGILQTGDPDDEVLEGPFVQIVNPPAVTTPAAASLCLGFESALYGRIHLIPTVLGLGNVLTDTQVNIEVWNAFSIPQTLDSITPFNAEGVTVASPTPPGAPPAAFPARASFLYQVTVLEEGPAVIDATFTFDFTVQSPVLSVTGLRVVTWAFCPQRPITESLEWQTNILEAFDGDEQRVRWRNLPRQLFDMNFLEDRDLARTVFLNTIFGHHGKPYAMPVWHFGRPLLQDAAINDTTIFVDTTNADFRDSTATDPVQIILFRDYNDFEIAQVAVGGLQAGQIDLERPLTADHSAVQTEVIPMQIMLAKDPVEWSLTGNGVMRVSSKWIAEEVVDLAAEDGDLTLLSGLPVLTGFNFIEDTLTEKYLDKYELFDAVSGTFESIQRRTIGEYQTTKGFETDTALDSWDLRKLIYALRGKQRSFWMPTWRADFDVVNTIGSSDLTLTVTAADHERFLDGIEPFSAVMVLLRDGTQFFRRIIAIGAGAPGEESISIDTDLGVTVTVPEIRLVSYVVRARLNTDRITFQHRQKGVVSVRTPVVGVKQ